jgi:hypothetical protein
MGARARPLNRGYMQFKWEDHLKARVKTLTIEGISKETIAVEIGCHPSTVQQMQYRLGLKNRKNIRVFTDDEKATVRVLYPNTLNREIARLLNCTYFQLIHVAHRMNLEKSREFIATHGGSRPLST